MIEYFSKNSFKISYFPVFPTLAKFGVFPRTVITGNYRCEFPPPLFPRQPCLKGRWLTASDDTAAVVVRIFCVKLLPVAFTSFYVFKGSNCSVTNKVNSGLLINLDIAIFVMKNDLKYSILIFSVMLEVNL